MNSSPPFSSLRKPTPLMRFQGALRRWRGLIATPVLASLCFPLDMQANPTDGQVVSGQAVISSSGSTLTINQSSDRAIIHWQDFSIPYGSTTKFVQPSATSAALNRVMGGNPSQIYGNLQANGQVYLINPNGVLVGASGVINTAGFLASTLDVSDESFVSGSDLRFKGTSAKSVINMGKISASSGDVILIARTVENHGEINAPKGTAAMAAGSEVLVKASGEERVFVEGGSSSGTSSATQAGLIKAASAEIKAAGGNEYALAIKHTGVTRATGVVKSGGRVYLSAGKGKIRNSGQVVARKSNGGGGKVRIEANHVELTSTSKIDVSAKKNAEVGNGGEVLIGGGYQGQDESIRNAQTVTAELGSVIISDAATSGDGGKVIVWSDGTTDFAGNISARGGSVSGDGGFAEVSGKEYLTMSGHADLRATNGVFGSLLLDPGSVTIQKGANTTPPSAWNSFNDAWISDQLAGGSIAIRTSMSTNNGVETITVNGDVEIVWNTKTTLTLEAGKNIMVSAGATITNSYDGENFDAIVLHANQDKTIFSGSYTGIVYVGNFSTQSGNVVMKGYSGNQSSSGIGVRMGSTSDTSKVTTTKGDIIIEGGVNGPGTWEYGLYVYDGTTIISESTNINSKVSLIGFSEYESVVDKNTGVYYNGSVQSQNANIIIKGSRENTLGASSYSVQMGTAAKVTSLGSGNIELIAMPPLPNSEGTDMNLSSAVTIEVGTGNIILHTDQISSTFGTYSSTGKGKMLIQPLSPERDIAIATTATNAINLSATGLNGIQDGFSEVIIGHENGSGTILVGTYTFKDNLIIRTGDGDISINGSLATGSGSQIGTITLQAGRNIIGSSGASVTTQGQDVTLNSDRDEMNGGNIQLTKTTIQSNGGSITLGGGDDPTTKAAIGSGVASVAESSGIYLTTSTLIDAGSGALLLRGQGNTASSTANGIHLAGSTILGSDTGTGSITLIGSGGGDTGATNYGIQLSGNSQIKSATGDILLQGKGGYGSSAIELSGSTISSTGTAQIILEGMARGGTGASNKHGVSLLGASKIISSGSGLIEITGHGGSGSTNEKGGAHYGINVATGASVESTGTGEIHMDGIGGLSTADTEGNTVKINSGIYIAGTVKSATAKIIMDGIGGGYQEYNVGSDTWTDISPKPTTGVGGDNHGIVIKSGKIISTTSADIVLTGQGGVGSLNYNSGIRLENPTAEVVSQGSGNIVMNGTGGGGVNSHGIYLYGAAKITSEQTGSISLYGTSINTSAAVNILGYASGTSVVKSNDGNIYVKGTSVGGSSVNLGGATYGGEIISNGSGSITIEGIGGTTSINSADNSPSRIGTGFAAGSPTASGDITLIGDKITLGNQTEVKSDGHLVIKPHTSTATIGIGASAAGTLALTPATLDTLQDGFKSITIGHENGSGTIEVGSYTFKDDLIIRTPIGNGDILLKGALATGSGSEAGSITLQAGRNIIGSSGASVTTQGKSITLNSDRDEVNGGNIQLTGTTVASNGGAIIMGGGGNPATTAAIGSSTASTAQKAGIYLTGSSIDSGAGTIEMRGHGVAGTSAGYGIHVLGGTVIGSATHAGSITLDGTGGAGTSSNYGVFLTGVNTMVHTEKGNVMIIGQGGDALTTTNYGISMSTGAQVISEGSGTVTLRGTGGNGTQTNHGIVITGSGTEVASSMGAILIEGQGGNGAGPNNNEKSHYGIYLTGAAQIRSTGAAPGAATITLDGTGGKGNGSTSGYADNAGIMIQSAGTKISSAYGDILLTGQGGERINGDGATTLRGIYVSDATIESIGSGAGAAKITLDGTGNVKGGQDQGIWFSNSAKIFSKDGDISMTGRGNVGLLLGGTSQIKSTGSGNIHLIGEAPGSNADIGYYKTTPVIETNTGNIVIEADIWYRESSTNTFVEIRSVGNGSLFIQPRTPGASIGIGTGSTGMLNLDAAHLDWIKDGFSEIYIGHEEGTGLVTVGTYTKFKDNLIIRTPKGDGDITVNGSIATGSGLQAGSISLQAGRNIIGKSGASITTEGEDITLNSDRDATNAGNIQLTGTSIQSNGGDIVFGGGATPKNGAAESFSANNTNSNRGIFLTTNSIVSAGAGDIFMRGKGQDGHSSSRGIELNGSTVETTTGTIYMHGEGGAYNSSQQAGISLVASTVTSDSGQIDLYALGGSGGNSMGFLLWNGAEVLSRENAAITITGVGTGSGVDFYSSRSPNTTYVSKIGNHSDPSKGGNIVLNIDTTNHASSNTSFQSTGSLTIQPRTDNTTIGIGGGSGTLNLTMDRIKALQDGFSEIVIGNEQTGLITSNAATFTDNLRLVTGADLAINGALDVGTNRLALIAGGNTTQTAALTAGSLRLGGNGNFNLSNADNKIGTMAKDGTGSVSLQHATTLTVGSVDGVNGVTGSTVDLRTKAGNIVLNKNVTGTAAGDSVVLSTPAAFINNAGSGAVTAAGRWLIYSNAPGGNTFGSLNSSNQALYGRPIGSAAPASITQTGNRYIFAIQPELTVTASLIGVKTYGDTYTPPALVEGTHYQLSGFINAASYGNVFVQDSAVNIGRTGSPTVSSIGAPAAASVGGYNFSIGQGDLNNTAGYQFKNFVSGGSLTVNQKGLTITVNDLSKTYGDTLNSSDFSYSITGLVNGDQVDNVELTSLGAAATADASVLPYLILVSKVEGDNLDNYAIDSSSANLTVTKRLVTIYVDSGQGKVYGDNDPASYDYTTSGLGGGVDLDGLLSREVGEDVGNWEITQGSIQESNNSNYTLSFEKDYFEITPRPVTITVKPGQGKVYGGTEPPSYTYTDSGLGSGKALEGALSREAGEDVGTYAITPGTLIDDNNPNYTLTFKGDYFKITKKGLIVTANNFFKPYLQANPEFTASLSGFEFGDSMSSLGGSLQFATPAILSSGPGVYSITPFGLISDNYEISFVDGTLTVHSHSGMELLRRVDMADPNWYLLREFETGDADEDFDIEYQQRSYPRVITSLGSGDLDE